MPTRVLYAMQTASVAGHSFGVQSASCETTIPSEDLVVFARLGSAGRFQKDVATCKSDIKIYATTGLGEIVDSLITLATAGTASAISVTPNGFSMSGILSSFSLDASKGDFVTASMSFAGVGEATHAAAGAPTTVGAQGTITPMTSNEVTVAGTCPSTLKYSLDIPNEVVSCLGGVIEGSQATIVGSHTMFSKPPFKSSITVDGLNVGVAAALTTFSVGTSNSADCFEWTDAAATIVSKSFNQSAGDVGATYSLNVEGTNVTITAGQA